MTRARKSIQMTSCFATSICETVGRGHAHIRTNEHLDLLLHTLPATEWLALPTGASADIQVGTRGIGLGETIDRQ